MSKLEETGSRRRKVKLTRQRRALDPIHIPERLLILGLISLEDLNGAWSPA
jgi:hypothetical protein